MIKKIAVISDTHGLLREEVVKILKTCDVIFHGGDMDCAEIYQELKELGEVYAVKGNNDFWYRPEELPVELEIEQYGIRFYMLHDKSMISYEREQRADVIIYGHSHQYEMHRENGKIYLNPGSCGRERFGLPITMAMLLLDTETKEISIERIEFPKKKQERKPVDMRKVITGVLKDLKKGKNINSIALRNQISIELTEQICRIYVTHPGVDVEGIMNKMEVSSLYPQGKREADFS